MTSDWGFVAALKIYQRYLISLLYPAVNLRNSQLLTSVCIAGPNVNFTEFLRDTFNYAQFGEESTQQSLLL